jgi:predicted DNA-binding ribbon-helix-helix protein
MSHSKKRTKTTLIHRHVRIDDRPTSLALEPEFWRYLREIAYTRRATLGRLLSVINQHKGKDIPLASALRIFVAQHYRGEQKPSVAGRSRKRIASGEQ